MKSRTVMRILQALIWLIPVLFLLFGAIVYTPEYLGNGTKAGPLKLYLDRLNNFSLSNLFIYIAFTISIYLSINIAFLIIKMLNKYVNIIEGQTDKIRSIQQNYDVINRGLSKSKNENENDLEQSNLQKNRIAQDELVINRILSLLPVGKTLRITRKISFGNKFLEEYVDIISNYVATQKDPTYILFDKYLEEQRNILAERFRSLTLVLLEYSESVDDNTRRISTSLKEKGTYSEIVKKANDLADEAGEAYENIIKYCREHFGMSITSID